MTRTVHFSLAFLIAFLLMYCLHFNVDVGDEGYYLYHFQQGPEAIGFNFYHLLISPIGKLFDHLLIGYRYLNVLLVIGSCLFLYKSISKSIETYWLFPLCAGLLYFNQISTLSYNSIVLIGGTLFLGLVYHFIANGASLFHPLFIGLIAFVVFSARFGVGILILFFGMTVFFLMLNEKKKFFKYSFIQFLSFCVPMILIYLIYPDYFSAMFKYIKVLSGVSHDGLLIKYFNHTFRYAMRSFLAPLIILVITLKWPKYQKGFTFAYLSWFLFVYVIKDFNFASLFYYVTGLIMAFAFLKLYELWKSRLITKKDLTFTVLPIAFYLASVAGTNNNAMKAAPYNFIFLLPCLVFIIPGRRKTSSLLAISFGVITFICLFQNQYLKAYGSSPRSQQTYSYSTLPVLKGILIDEKLESNFINIKNMLKREGYVSSRDKIFGYSNIPGYTSYLEAKSFGSSWNSDSYKNSDSANCYSVKNEQKAPREQLFVLLTKELTPMLEKCLRELHTLTDSKTLVLSAISSKKEL